MTKRKLPAITQSEEFAAWGIGIVVLYYALRLKLSKKFVIPLLTFDTINAYNHYPTYKSIGFYPSAQYMGIPSISMLLSILLVHAWKKIRNVIERAFSREYQSAAEIVFATDYNVELDDKALGVLQAMFRDLKTELLAKKLYSYLYIVDNTLISDFENLEHYSNKPDRQSNDYYYKIFTLFELSKKILEFTKP